MNCRELHSDSSFKLDFFTFLFFAFQAIDLEEKPKENHYDSTCILFLGCYFVLGVAILPNPSLYYWSVGLVLASIMACK